MRSATDTEPETCQQMANQTDQHCGVEYAAVEQDRLAAWAGQQLEATAELHQRHCCYYYFFYYYYW